MQVLWDQSIARLLPLELDLAIAINFIDSYNKQFFEKKRHLFGDGDA